MTVRRFRLRLPLLVFLAGIGLSAVGAWQQDAANQRYARDELGHLASTITQQINNRLWLYQYGLRGARGAVISAGYEAMTRSQFLAYHQSRDIDVEFPGARGFGLIRRVSESDLPAFLASARWDEAPNFEIRSLAPHDGARYVILYIEPVTRNGPAVGLDIASEISRRTAADNAMRSGRPIITAPITLVQASAKPSQSFLVLLPVYRRNMPTSTVEEREAALFGWVYAPLVMSEILNDVDAGADRAQIAVYDVTDHAEAGADRTLDPFYGERPPRDGMQHAEHLEVYGRQWLVIASPTAKFFSRLRLTRPQDMFLYGTALALLFATLSYAFQENRRRRRDALDKQALLATIVENVNDAIIAEDEEGRITGWNRAAEKIFGYPERDALLHSGSDFLWRGAGLQAVSKVRQQAREGIATAAFDTVGRHRDGTDLDLAVTAAPITNAEGNVGGVGFTIRDIRERKAAERARAAFSATLEQQVTERTAQLETARKDLQTILDAVPSMIGYWDRNLVNRVANRAYADWFGVDPERIQGRHIRDLLGDEIFNLNRPYMDAALRGEPQTFERDIPRPGGRGTRHSLAHYLPDIVKGEVQGFYVLVHDITEIMEGRQHLAHALRENEALLNTIKLHALYTETLPDGTIIDINESLCRIIGYRREDLIGQSIRILDSDAHDPAFIAAMRATIASGTVWRGDLCNRGRDGTRCWFETIIVPFVDAEGLVTKYVSLRTDITARLATDDALHEAKRAAEAANAAKSAFLANMSHEIRTPLNAVIGLDHLLQRTALDPLQKDYVAKSLTASKSLLSLVDDILDLAKIEAGEMDVESVTFDPRALLAELHSVMAAQAAAKGLALDFSLTPDLPPFVQGDPTRLRQILLNLVSNAIKFTSRGGIEVRVHRRPTTGDEAALVFEIEDSGIGIAPDVLPRLFTPFEQADSSTSRRFGGTGLGLSIVRHMATLLSGTIEVQSKEGKGSTFTVTLPFTIPAPAPADTQRGGADETREMASDSLGGVRILVVDDAAVNLDICCSVLAQYGAVVTPCDGGRAALEALRRSPRDFDIVLTDVQMPDIDGIELTRRIILELGLKNLPVIALSADALTTERQRALQAGMRDFLLKPFDPVTLVKRLRDHVAPDHVPAPDAGQVAPPRPTRDGNTPPWSVVESIDGIDAADAAMRLNRNGGLFMSVLDRFLHECRDLTAGAVDRQDPALAARMHKLRGSAGSIGARDIARLAGALEGRLTTSGADRVSEVLLADIVLALSRLRASSAAALAPFSPIATAVASADETGIKDLMRLLLRHDLAALGAFTPLESALKARLSPEDFESLRASVAGLRFEAAGEMLRRLAAP